MNKLEGLGFSNYRSIGKDPLFLYPFSKVNLFVGPNNCGKSNILRFIKRWVDKTKGFENDDYPKYDKSLQNKVFIPIHISETNRLNIPDYQYYTLFIGELKKLVCSELFNYDTNNKIVWFDKTPQKECFDKFASSFNPLIIQDFALKYVGENAINDSSENIRKIINKFFYDIKNTLPKIEKCIYIKAHRDLFDHSKNGFLDDEKIIEKLNKIINHQASETNEEDDKQSIEKFISDLIGRPIRINIPSTLDSINLISANNPKEQYNLDQLGSGIHEIIYFALIATLNHNCLVCIDEPEIHLHPRLQREFLEYIANNTDNQYFIATHSSAFINTSNEEVGVFKVSQNKDGYTKCKFVSNMEDLSQLVDSLGCKASDIIQSNCVIWVEGPSDRIYVNYWIHGKKNNLKEGIDYSVMFYGGRLLSHISGNKDLDSEFINLLKINRNSFIIIDSDKKDEDQPINSTKERVLNEFGKRCWITKGREIENYLFHEQYSNVVNEIDKSFKPRSGNYVNLLGKGDNSLDKVRFAKRITEKYPEPFYEKLDLEERVNDLISFIDNSNK